MTLRIPGVALAILSAACGNGSGAGSDAGSTAVTVGGALSGLSEALVLTNNGGDALTLVTNGAFTFATPLSSGARYDVEVKTQPANQRCSITYGSGTALVSTASVAVLCTTNVQSGQRALPAIYSTGKAVGYSGYRAGGPGAGEVPTDAQITQDLALMNAVGFNLIRLFGADAFTTAVLRLATANQPAMKFQLGIYLEGAGSNCSDPVNTSEMATAIALANQYSNVVAVSVGNETSFAANLPVACLVQYIRSVRNQVTQPVTADDDYTFYAGLTSSGEKPDTVFAELDFLSIHLYPFATANNNAWDWKQSSVAAGPDRATAMMAASLVWAKSAYASVASYQYKNASGISVKVSDGLPITVGESGWKARKTNSSAIETIANPAIANPVNAKEYLDLLGTWHGAGAPLSVFYFEAFDESWKGIDDGWGLWDSSRAPRYALCGLGPDAACNGADNYSGAGWYH
jgi:exo-beta-1,3-glucanase (GH17 family)